MKQTCNGDGKQGGSTPVLNYPNGRKYMDKLGLPRGMHFSKGLTAMSMEKVDRETCDLRLWDILWMFKSRSALGFEVNGITVYGVYGLDEGGGMIPLAVESPDGLVHTIMLPEECGRLNMTSSQCGLIIKRKNTPGSAKGFFSKMISALSCHGISCDVTIHKARGDVHE